MAFPWTPVGIYTSPMDLTGKQNPSTRRCLRRKVLPWQTLDEVLENHPRTCMRLRTVVSPLRIGLWDPFPNGH